VKVSVPSLATAGCTLNSAVLSLLMLNVAV
jgi:hypothetical protein